MVMFAGSYFCILLTQFTLTVVQISAFGGKKKKTQNKTICNVPNVRISQEKRKSLKTLFLNLAPSFS